MRGWSRSGTTLRDFSLELPVSSDPQSCLMRLKTNPISAVFALLSRHCQLHTVKMSIQNWRSEPLRNCMIGDSVFLPLTDGDEERVSILLRDDEITGTFNFNARLRASRN